VKWILLSFIKQPFNSLRAKFDENRPNEHNAEECSTRQAKVSTAFYNEYKRALEVFIDQFGSKTELHLILIDCSNLTFIANK
jgi:hypothetical protein